MIDIRDGKRLSSQYSILLIFILEFNYLSNLCLEQNMNNFVNANAFAIRESVIIR